MCIRDRRSTLYKIRNTNNKNNKSQNIGYFGHFMRNHKYIILQLVCEYKGKAREKWAESVAPG